MKKLLISIGGATLAVLVVVGAVAAAGPRSGPAGGAQVRDRDAIPEVLGLTQGQVAELRQDGLSLAQIAERQHVDPQELVDALVARWAARIEARVANGAISADRATELKNQLEVQARSMVYRTTLGGMQGAAVAAGPGAGAMDGTASGAARGWRGAGTGTRGAGTGICDGSGPG